MNINQILYNNSWLVYNCDQCQSKQYVENKVQHECSCGNKNLSIVPIEQFTAVDFAIIANREFEKAEMVQYVEFPNNFLGEINQIIKDERLLSQVMKAFCDKLYEVV